ncbi:AcrR family transcriptional regulator [Deinococcus budaensis]|uniref:AcrR family transcriptional regulator n=1 Tax=Deinococcus budaensis TaxID=1665626 RepID=A0A7W8GGE1_9DEIO|nr:TetR/AcrR family transcriptional regulator [Deinococcus budaensis]MBB5234743.1 AcrR family transcriptional regulator [Deinococcus budaensis]
MPRPPADQPLLTPDRITTAALRMIDQDGADALSTRKLAAVLGVSSKAVYHYYATKDELLHAVYLSILDDLDLPEDSGGTWEEQLRRFAQSFRRLARRHPSFLTGFLGPHAPTARELDALDAFYTLLRRSGLPDALVLPTGQLLLTFLIGYLRAELGGTFQGDTYRARVAAAARQRARYRTLPDLPVPAEGDDATFDLALDLLIASLRGGAAAPARS